MPSLRRKLPKDGCLNGHPRTGFISFFAQLRRTIATAVEVEPATPTAYLQSSASAVMAILESVKRRLEKVTGWARPSARDLDAALRPRKANAFRFEDDGVIPNNPKLPLVLYRSPVRLSGRFDPAAVFEELFERNGWGDSWRNGHLRLRALSLSDS
jgi:hypothetical protein